MAKNITIWPPLLFVFPVERETNIVVLSKVFIQVAKICFALWQQTLGSKVCFWTPYQNIVTLSVVALLSQQGN